MIPEEPLLGIARVEYLWVHALNDRPCLIQAVVPEHLLAPGRARDKDVVVAFSVLYGRGV